MPAGLTPFGVSIRALRRQQGISQKQMAIDLQISAAYLSALERGQRGRPSPVLVDQTHHITGVVTDIDQETGSVEIDITVSNEEEETRVFGTATAKLPTS